MLGLETSPVNQVLNQMGVLWQVANATACHALDREPILLTEIALCDEAPYREMEEAFNVEFVL